MAYVDIKRRLDAGEVLLLDGGVGTELERRGADMDPAAWCGVATLANTLGSILNWSLGRWGANFRDRSWFPVAPATYDRAAVRFRRWGTWSLLLAWVPIIGDPLTLIAGAAGVPILPFVLLVAIGKAARYAVVLALV